MSGSDRNSATTKSRLNAGSAKTSGGKNSAISNRLLNNDPNKDGSNIVINRKLVFDQPEPVEEAKPTKLVVNGGSRNARAMYGSS